MKDFGAWFNEQQPEPGAPQPEQACAAQGAAGCVINDPYLSAGALMGGCLAPGQLASYAAPTQRDMFAQRQEPQLLHRERAHVVLHGDALSPQMFDEDCTFDDVSRWLQRAVAQRWEVYPVDMVSASEDMKYGGGSLVEVHAQTFGLRVALDDLKQATPWAALQLAQHLWAELQNAWPVGMLVLWRRRPLIETFPALIDATTLTRRPPELWISVRMAGWLPPQGGCRVHVAEGDRFSTIEDLA